MEVNNLVVEVQTSLWHLSAPSIGTFSVGIEFLFPKSKIDDPLFVLPKYFNLKEEVAEYRYLNIKHWKENILPKAMIYHNTAIIISI